MKKLSAIAAGISLIALLVIPPIEALAWEWQEAVGKTDIGLCDGGRFMIVAGNGHGKAAISNPRTFIFVSEQNAFLDFDRTGTVKTDGNFDAWAPYPDLFTRYKLKSGADAGTITFSGQNRVLFWGFRDDVTLSGNYEFGTALVPPSCP